MNPFKFVLLSSALAAVSSAFGAGTSYFEDIPYEPVVSENPAFQRGMTYFPLRKPLTSHPRQTENLDRMLATGVEWVTLVTAWYQPSKAASFISPDPQKTASDESMRQVIRYLHDNGAKVMLKPYVNSKDGVWRANFEPKSVNGWFNSYRKFIYHYADMAAEEEVEMFCVGVEYKWCDENEYNQWLDTIEGIKSRYDGELTYAAHWGNYRNVCFWDEVDYVGIDAYYHLSPKDAVTLSALVKSWRGPLDEIEAWRYEAGVSDKEVILTEVGYQSRPGCWKTPAKTKSDEPDAGAQEICYKALFMAAPARPWLRGIYIWSWDHWDAYKGGGPEDTTWTPKRKPAETVLSDYYHSY